VICLSREEAGRALGLPPLREGVSGVSIDSRTLRAGDLFVALPGARFDGHDFVVAALQAGASGAVVRSDRLEELKTKVANAFGCPPAQVNEGMPAPPGTAQPELYPVPDTLQALWALAREVRRKAGVLVIAVTGSVGKTTTKDILGALVGRSRRVLTTASNQNNEIGVPLTLLALETEIQVAVAEMGMRGRGQIAALAAVAEPDIGVITNIHPVHLELLGDLESIAEAKAELLCGLKPGGVGVVPADCDVLVRPAARAGCRLVRFVVEDRGVPGRAGREATALRGGTDGGALRCEAEVTVRLENVGADHRLGLRVRWPEGEAEVELKGLPRYLAENVAAAAAACYAAGLPMRECLVGLEDIQIGRGRGQVLSLPGLTVIDDTYNANPTAVKRALENLIELCGRRGGRPVAVLGDMLELGPKELSFHAEVGRYAAELGVAELWGVGERSRVTVQGFLEVPGEKRAGHIASALENCSVLAALQPGDVVLVKASRSLGLETLVSAIVQRAQQGFWRSGGGEGSRS